MRSPEVDVAREAMLARRDQIRDAMADRAQAEAERVTAASGYGWMPPGIKAVAPPAAIDLSADDGTRLAALEARVTALEQTEPVTVGDLKSRLLSRKLWFAVFGLVGTIAAVVQGSLDPTTGAQAIAAIVVGYLGAQAWVDSKKVPS